MTDLNLQYGATSEEWDAFIALAKPDLLPYLADPRVAIEHYSRVTPGSKTPGRVLPSTGKGVGMLGWPKHVATDGHLIEWRADPRHGICLITRNIRAVDVDVADQDQANRIAEFIQDFLGTDLPLRTRADSGKRTLLYRIADAKEPLRKWIVPTPHGPIEFLFDGQQTVVAGRHPQGARYEWPNGFPTSADIPAFDLSTIIELIRAVKTKFGTDGFTREWGVNAPAGIVPSQRPTTPDPVVDFLIANDLLVDFAPDGACFVKCPWEEYHGSATSHDAAKYYPTGHGRDDGGFHCLHAHSSYPTNLPPLVADKHAFLTAIGYVEYEFEALPATPSERVPVPRPAMTYKGKSNAIEPTLENCVALFRWVDGAHIDLRYDTFRDSIMYRVDESPWQPLTDDSYTEFRLRLTRVGMEAGISKQHVVDAVSFVAREHSMDSALEWLNTKHWDGVPRVSQFHTQCLKLADTPYHEAVGRYMWSAMAGRVLEPGVKVDMVPVLSGWQGQRKTSLVELLCPSPNEFVTLDLSNRDDDLARSLRGVLVAEWGELRGLETRDAESIKGWLTQRADKWIPKFKEFSTTHLRRFFIIATTNRRRYLNDPTGSRRYLPLVITTGNIGTEWLIEHRDQLWAEGAHLFREYGVLWQDAHELATQARADAEFIDSWMEAVATWLGQHGTDGMTTAYIANQAVGVPVPNCNTTVQRRIHRIMSALGWHEGQHGRWFCDLA